MGQITNSHHLKKQRSWFSSKPMLVLMLIAVFFLGRATFDVYGKFVLSQNNFHRTHAEEMMLLEQKEDLSEQVEKLSTERGMEEMVRRNLPVGRPGEKMIVVVDDDEDQELEDLESDQKEDENRWLFWRD